MGFIDSFLSKLKNQPDLQGEVELALNDCPTKVTDPLSAMKDIPDDELLELFLNPGSYPELKEFIPLLPPDEMQQNWTGASGRQALTYAMNFHEIVRGMAKAYSTPLSADSLVLDFGCGWGRIIRFFLKDVKHDNLFGTDCYEDALAVARAQNKWCNFDLNSTTPPLGYGAEKFDLIYLYSVFSHLSEEMHLKWIEEFYRVLKPGGLIVATTRSREFILFCRQFKNTKVLNFQSGLARSFADTDHFLTLYDQGEFCHSPTGGGGPLDSSFYGETCIPEAYVKNNWAKWFDLVEFRQADQKCDQDIICCRKR